MTKDEKKKTVLIIGVGGLGCTVASLLARKTINLILMDGDIVEKSNLDRQLLFFNEDIGKPKVEVAKNKLSDFTKMKSIFDNFNEKTIQRHAKLFNNIDLIVDCTDNMESRVTINRFSLKTNIPWIYSAVVKDIGAIYFNNPKDKNRACFECFSKEKVGESSCKVGVENTSVSMVASLTAKMAIDFLSYERYNENLLRISGYSICEIKTKKRENCICSMERRR